MIGLVVQVIIREMDKVLRFAQVRPNHPHVATNKNRRSMFGTNKMNFDFTLPTQFTNIGVKKTLFIIVFNLVVQVSILYKWPCSQCSVQQK